MAGPFCALWAQGRRAAAHSGGPRPSRPASASVRPRSGRGPAGGPLGPGLGPALPTRRPRGLVLRTARQGDASPAGWWGLPSAPSGRVPPAPSGLRAATPARPGRLGRRPPRPPAAVGVMWRLVAAFGGSGRAPAGLASRQPLLGGTSPRRKAKSPSGARSARPCPAPPPRRSRRRCSGPPRPHSWGAFGAVRPSGPGGPGSGQPPRAGPPAALPALVRLCLRLALPA
jgi:hypothetical protein